MPEFAGPQPAGRDRMTKQPSSADIAVIGMSAKFAKAPDLTAFWHNILGSVDAIHDASDEWVQHFLDSSPADFDRIYTRRGGFLGDRVEFDPTEFGIMPNAIHTADADHFLALKVRSEERRVGKEGERRMRAEAPQ